MPGIDLVVAVAIGYLIGAIPSGVLVGRLRGVDPRDSGSGRTGTTNALRSLGPRWAAAVALLDVAKGIAAVVAGGAIGPEPWAGALAGVAAVVGHVRSVFIGFGGGRGVATGAGAMLVLAPLAVLASLPEFGIIVWATRLVSLGSMLAAVTVALVAAALYALAHADNIQRLVAGTERRIGDG
jgi:glycerol-3-phosphate acyltransferase PlsY